MQANAEEGFVGLEEKVPNFVSSDTICHTIRCLASSEVLRWVCVEAGLGHPWKRKHFCLSVSPTCPEAGHTMNTHCRWGYGILTTSIGVKARLWGLRFWWSPQGVSLSPEATSDFLEYEESSLWILSVVRESSGSCCLSSQLLASWPGYRTGLGNVFLNRLNLKTLSLGENSEMMQKVLLLQRLLRLLRGTNEHRCLLGTLRFMKFFLVLSPFVYTVAEYWEPAASHYAGCQE